MAREAMARGRMRGLLFHVLNVVLVAWVLSGTLFYVLRLTFELFSMQVPGAVLGRLPGGTP